MVHSHPVPKNEVSILVESPNHCIGLALNGGPDLLSWGQFLASKGTIVINNIETIQIPRQIWTTLTITANVEIIAHCALPTTKPNLSGHQQTLTRSITCTYTLLTNSEKTQPNRCSHLTRLSLSSQLRNCLFFIRKPPGYIGDFSRDFSR